MHVVTYNGPFSAVVAEGGAIYWTGSPVLVSAEVADYLKARGDFSSVPVDPPAAPPVELTKTDA